jgi:septal ring factor EnvC (AmiA/AmiB activator)
MVAKRLYIIPFLLLSFLTPIFPQVEQIDDKKEELTRIKIEISELEKELEEETALEKESVKVLENYNKQSFLLNKIINNFRREEEEHQAQINTRHRIIKSIEAEIEVLKENYANYIVAIYKKGPLNELESVIDSESLQQAILRIQYLKKFSDRREKDLEELEIKKAELITAKTLLQQEINEKKLLAEKKRAEEEVLQPKLDERKKILNNIRQDKAKLKAALDAKKEAQSKIKNIIAKLIEEEKQTKQQLASVDGTVIIEEDTGIEYDLGTASFSSFAKMKGEMLWPLHEGKIIGKFGENKNNVLNTVTLNYGIDIEAKADNNVRCVAEGVVSAIDWLPGYGSVIIVSHNEDYRTVYGHLEEIFVQEADRVKTGTVLAKIGESVDGKVLHFEIWKARLNRDPEPWLAKN